MSKPKFTVIEGGLSASIFDTNKEFVSAYITDTRLMGVMGMYVHWRFTEAPAATDFHQFFYFDAEEYGFESYKSVLGNNVEKIASIEQTMINGLGGRKNELSEREVCTVLWHYVLFNRAHNLPLPGDVSEYQSLLDQETVLPAAEEVDLVQKLCAPIASPYHAINYFLMRCFGHDYEAAGWLCCDGVDTHLYQQQHPQATFCKNTIDYEGGAFICESLIEYSGHYHLVISRLTVDEALMVTGFEHCSGFMISSAEAAMMLAKAEFITVYETLIPVEEFASLLGQVPLNCLITPHKNGKLYMMFHNHNNHVNQQVFMLSADVAGIYYLSNSGQLLAVAYTLPEIQALEKDIRKSVISPYAIATGKYEFKEPVLYDFVESQFEDFNEFLEVIQSGKW